MAQKPKPRPPQRTVAQNEDKLHLPISIQVGQHSLEEDLASALEFSTDVEGLVQALKLNPILSAKWGLLQAEATSEVARLTDKVKMLEAELFEYFQNNLPGGGTGRAPTIDATKAAVKSSPQMQAANQELRDMQHTLELIRVAYNSFFQRKDTLIEVSRLARREMDSGMA